MDPFVGQIELFPFSVIPSGWTQCNGRLLPIQQYQALFALIGTTYGGDGRKDFRIPDLRGRAPVGLSASYLLGLYDGVEHVALTTGNLPSHTHSFTASGADGATGSPSGNYFARVVTAPNTPTAQPLYAPAQSGGVQIAFNSEMVSVTGSAAGHNNMQPFLALSYCIALNGVFPPRPY